MARVSSQIEEYKRKIANSQIDGSSEEGKDQKMMEYLALSLGASDYFDFILDIADVGLENVACVKLRMSYRKINPERKGQWTNCQKT